MPQNLGRFEKIFDTCLESILSGQESLDSTLAKNPRLAGELRPRLEAALTLVSSKHLFDPAPDFVQRSRQSLVSRAQREPRYATTGIVVWLAGLWRFLQTIRLSPQLTAAAMTAAVIMILIAGGSATALLAEGSIPGDTLYPVKNAIEDTRLGLTTDPANQASLHLEIARRRVAEIQVLTQEQRWEPVQFVMADYESHLNEAVRQIKLIFPQEAARARDLAQTLEQMMVSHQALLATAAQGMPELARSSVEHALSMNEAHLLFAQDVIVQIDPGVVLGTHTPTPTVTAMPLPTRRSTNTVIPPTKTVTGTPGTPGTPDTPAPGSLTPTLSTLTASPTPVGTPGPTITATPSPQPAVEAVEPTPTKKPTPTRRPKPTRKPTKTPKN